MNWIQIVIKMFLLKILSWQILWSIVEGEKRGIRAIEGFRKKQFIPDYEISVAIEHVVKSKIGTIFVNEDILEEKSVKVYKIDPYFSEHYKKKYKLMIMIKNTYCLELIIYFTEYSLAIEIDEKGHTDRDLEFKKKKGKRHYKKNLIINLLELILVEKILM